MVTVILKGRVGVDPIKPEIQFQWKDNAGQNIALNMGLNLVACEQSLSLTHLTSLFRWTWIV